MIFKRCIVAGAFTAIIIALFLAAGVADHALGQRRVIGGNIKIHG